MKGARDYTAIACNDRVVIMASTLRRALQEMHRLGDGEIGAGRYSGRSFQALHACICSMRAGYLHHAARKVRDRLLDDVPEDVNVGTLHAFMLRMVKAGVDHVGSVRVGATLAAAIAERCLVDLLDDPRSMDEWDGNLELGDALGRIAAYIPVADSILDSAVSKYLSGVDAALVGRAFEVFSHDATAPVILVAPDAPAPLVPAKDIAAQMTNSVLDFATANFERLFDEAIEGAIAAPFL